MGKEYVSTKIKPLKNDKLILTALHADSEELL